MQLEVFRDRGLRLLERRRRGQLHLRSPLRIQARSSQPLALRGVQDEVGFKIRSGSGLSRVNIWPATKRATKRGK
jgi:hypothetical protein